MTREELEEIYEWREGEFTSEDEKNSTITINFLINREPLTVHFSEFCQSNGVIEVWDNNNQDIEEFIPASIISSIGVKFTNPKDHIISW